MKGVADPANDLRLKDGDPVPDGAETYVVYGAASIRPAPKRKQRINVFGSSEPPSPEDQALAEEYELGEPVGPEDHVPDKDLERLIGGNWFNSH